MAFEGVGPGENRRFEGREEVEWNGGSDSGSNWS